MFEGDKKLKNYKRGGGSVLPEGHYHLKSTAFKVVVGKESGASYVVGNFEVVKVEDPILVGKHTELGFSMSVNSESIAYAWFIALGCSEDDTPPKDDTERLTSFLKAKCLGRVVECDLEVANVGGYDKNQVTPPWGVVAVEGQTYTGSTEEEPPWAK